MSPDTPPPRRDTTDDGPAPGEPAPRERSSVAATVLATLAVIAALWWGQRFLIPLTAGLMLAMLVMPLNARLTRVLRSAVAATLLSLLMVLGTLVLGAMAFGGQFVRVAERTPDMIGMVTQQLAERDPGTDSLLTRARVALQELDRAADRMMRPEPPARPKRRAAAATTPAAAPAAASAPVASITEGATVALRETAVTGSSVLLAFAGNLSIIFFIAFFVLTGGAPLTERFLGLWGHDPRVHARARQALLESGRQIRIYGVVLLVTNTVIGMAVWVAFSLADLPDAAGWGAAAAVLHVIPYLGMALLTVLGAAETFLAHGTAGAALGMAGFVVLLSTLVGTLGTAWLQGHAAKMNAATVFIGLVFWGALWGIWGLFLGPALVVLIKVVAEHSRSGGRLAQLMKG
ncbi:AI-2E family transporter [uncultured Methylibium sp.]|uniref:AI-2E family transporter n=1 Tax=uncultured Methylibium sp. TaxID=381093 RepID=UPI0025D40A72|nr:AI-2E family transporter [uncultured Methylibium sp.]